MENQNTNNDTNPRNHSNGLVRTLGIVLLGSGIGALGSQVVCESAIEHAASKNPEGYSQFYDNPNMQKANSELRYLAVTMGSVYGAAVGLLFSGKK